MFENNILYTVSAEPVEKAMGLDSLKMCLRRRDKWLKNYKNSLIRDFDKLVSLNGVGEIRDLRIFLEAAAGRNRELSRLIRRSDRNSCIKNFRRRNAECERDLYYLNRAIRSLRKSTERSVTAYE